MKCEKVNQLVSENNSDVKTMIMFWFSGYYTGRNYETSSYPLKPDPELIYIATVNYCSNNQRFSRIKGSFIELGAKINHLI
jgi:hypothetical protein